MKRITDEKAFGDRESVVALGMFDGVHIGHQALLKETVRRAKEARIEPVAITFREHPLAALGRPVPPMLTDGEEKAELMRSMGIGTLIERPFTKEFADCPAEDYLKLLKAALAPRAIVAGYNYTFGRGGQGNAELLKRCARALGFEAVIVPPVMIDHQPVSSTAIRAALTRGDLRTAEDMLNRPYTLALRRQGALYEPASGMAVPGAGQYRVADMRPEAAREDRFEIEITPEGKIKAPGDRPDAMRIQFLRTIR